MIRSIAAANKVNSERENCLQMFEHNCVITPLARQKWTQPLLMRRPRQLRFHLPVRVSSHSSTSRRRPSRAADTIQRGIDGLRGTRDQKKWIKGIKALWKAVVCALTM